MLYNYFKIALRNLRRRKAYSIINITGLAIGIASSLIIFLYVIDEYSYDRFHDDADQVYRVYRSQNGNGGARIANAVLNYQVADILKDEFSEVETAVRMSRRWTKISLDGEDPTEERLFFFTEPEFFDVFSVNFLQGDPETALNDLNTLVITASMAEKYFGTTDALGKSLMYFNSQEMKITGVVEDFPPNSHFHFGFLTNIEMTRGWYSEDMYSHWGRLWTHTYAKLQPGVDPVALEARLEEMIDKHAPVARNFGVVMHIQPLTSIHLNSNMNAELEVNGNYVFVNVFLAVAILVLLIDGFNFINLSTARSSWRAKEVGLRKVVGADRSSLVYQFLGESILITGFSLVVAFIITEVSLPFFNDFAGKSISLNVLGNPVIWALAVGVILVVGIGSGSYPALMLSSFQPAVVLKGASRSGTGGRNSLLRKGLVIFQFSASIALIISTIVIFNQLDYIRSKDLGFDKEHLLQIRLKGEASRNAIPVLKERFNAHADILGVTAVSDEFPADLNSWRYVPPGSSDGDVDLIKVLSVDEDFFDAMGIDIEAGRGFSKEFPSDADAAVVLNRAAVKFLGIANPIGSTVEFTAPERKPEIIGVSEDFNFSSLYEPVAPLTIHLYKSWYDKLMIRFRGGESLKATLAAIEADWREVLPNESIEFIFLDQTFDDLYRADQKLGQLVGFFSIVAVFVACLGLFGLAAFTAEQRTREIGIRKVLGASIPGILALLSRDCLVLVLVGFGVAIPVTWYMMESWLQNFAYSVELGMLPFMVGGFVAAFIALGTVSYQSLKTASMNPIESLSSE